MYGRRSKGSNGDDVAKSRGALGGCALWRWGEGGSKGGRCDLLIAFVHILVWWCEPIVDWICGKLKGDCSENLLLVFPRAVGKGVHLDRLTDRGAGSRRGCGAAALCCCCCCCSTQRAHAPDPQARGPLSQWTEVWPTPPMLTQPY